MGSVVNEVEEAVRGVRENEERWREEMREVRGEVESVRELVPKVSVCFDHACEASGTVCMREAVEERR